MFSHSMLLAFNVFVISAVSDVIFPLTSASPISAVVALNPIIAPSSMFACLVVNNPVNVEFVEFIVSPVIFLMFIFLMFDYFVLMFWFGHQI